MQFVYGIANTEDEANTLRAELDGAKTFGFIEIDKVVIDRHSQVLYGISKRPMRLSCYRVIILGTERLPPGYKEARLDY